MKMSLAVYLMFPAIMIGMGYLLEQRQTMAPVQH
jgi:hypothetical protein